MGTLRKSIFCERVFSEEEYSQKQYQKLVFERGYYHSGGKGIPNEPPDGSSTAWSSSTSNSHTNYFRSISYFLQLLQLRYLHSQTPCQSVGSKLAHLMPLSCPNAEKKFAWIHAKITCGSEHVIEM